MAGYRGQGRAHAGPARPCYSEGAVITVRALQRQGGRSMSLTACCALGSHPLVAAVPSLSAGVYSRHVLGT